MLGKLALSKPPLQNTFGILFCAPRTITGVAILPRLAAVARLVGAICKTHGA